MKSPYSLGDVSVGKDGWAADADRLRLFGAGSPVSLVESHPAWGSSSQRKLLTSLPQVTVTEPTGPLGLDKKSCWVGGLLGCRVPG